MADTSIINILSALCHFRSKSSAKRSLERILPDKDRRTCEGKVYGWGCFKDTKERENFIEMVLHLVSDNGTRSLNGREFKIFYTRFSYQSEYKSSLVAFCGKTRVFSIMGERTWPTDCQAFKDLRLQIEKAVAKLLEPLKEHVPIARVETGKAEAHPPSYEST